MATEDLDKYFQDKGVKEFVTDLARALLVSQPENPKEFLQEYIATKHNITPSAHKPLKLIIAGPPASGKGTQAENIKKEWNVVHVSTGDLLRAEASAGTEIGLRAKEFMDNGQLVPDDVLIPIVQAHLSKPEVAERGWLLDGFPRTVDQAKALQSSNHTPDAFLLIEIDDSELVERVTGRRMDSETGEIYHLISKPPPADLLPERLVQRSDDTEEKLKARLEQYHSNITAVIDVYGDLVKRLEGNKGSSEVWKQIQDVVTNRK